MLMYTYIRGNNIKSRYIISILNINIFKRLHILHSEPVVVALQHLRPKQMGANGHTSFKDINKIKLMKTVYK